ncbi:MAG: hypothetical protein ACOX2R_03270 [Anaerolineae bacterium]|jgi:hypothetical protein
MKSRLERQWTTFLTELGVRWTCVAEDLVLAAMGWRQPTFRLPDLDLWLLVTHGEPTAEEWQGCETMAWEGDEPIVWFRGVPRERVGTLWCYDMTDDGSGGQSTWDEVSWVASPERGARLMVGGPGSYRYRDWCSRDFDNIRGVISLGHVQRGDEAAQGFFTPEGAALLKRAERRARAAT